MGVSQRRRRHTHIKYTRYTHTAMATPRKAPPVADAAASRPATAHSDSEKGSSVQVVVRMRPPSEKEKAANDTMVVGVYPQHSEVRVITNFKKAPASSVTGLAVAATPKQDTKTYTFDQTYGALSTQEEVYNQAVKPLVEGETLNTHGMMHVCMRV